MTPAGARSPWGAYAATFNEGLPEPDCQDARVSVRFALIVSSRNG